MALARIVPLDDAHPLDVAAFASGLDGSVVRPEDPDFEIARQVQNAVIDKRPAAIVRAATAADVVRTVNFARASGLELAVRGGSHSLAGHSTSEGGIVLDLSPMQGLHIDPDPRVAWAQAGLTAGAYTRAAAEFGLATPFGDTGSVGIAGLTLGAGIGWLARKHALAIDALLSVEIVTADGQLLVASETEHPDLFWAVRGGGGNFGVVTRFQYRLYPVSTVLGGMLLMPPTREVLRSLQPIASNAPEDLTTISFLMAAPPAPFVPEALHGQLVLALMFVYDGDEASGQAAIQPFRDLAAPLAEVVAPMPYPGIYEFLKDAEQRVPGSHRSVFLESIDDRTIDTILERMAEPPSPMTMVQLRVLGGAMARVPVEATAFAHRTAPAMVVILNLFPDPADAPRQEAWTQSFYEELAPRSTGVYVNFLEDEGEDRIREAYPVATYRRLAEIKRRYDPGNLFRLNQNIPPAGEG